MRGVRRNIFNHFEQKPENLFEPQNEKTVPIRVNTFNIFLKFLALSYPYWSKVMLCIIVSCVFVLVRMLWPWLDKIIIDDVIPNKDWKLLYILMAGRIIWIIVVHVLLDLRLLFRHYVHLWVLADLQTRFYDHLARLSLKFFQKRPSGEHIYRSSSDVGAVIHLITDIFPELVIWFFEFLIVLITLTLLDYRVTIAVLIYIIPYYLLTHWLSTKIKVYDKEARERWQNRDTVLQDALAGKILVKAFKRENFELRKYISSMILGYRSEWKKFYMGLTRDFTAGYFGFLPSMLTIGIHGWFFSQAILGNITYGSLMPIFTYLTLFRTPIQLLINIFQNMRIAMVPAERLMETISVKPTIKNLPDAINIDAIKGRVEFQNVNFAYEKNEQLFSNLNFKIKEGEQVSFLGQSGVGKSTILNLILRLFDPINGKIFIDNKDIRTIKMESLQQKIGYVAQDTYLFMGTIRDNILFGKHNATDSEINEILRKVELEDFIKSLKKGLDTDLQEGTSLSGGQRQRLGIARALIRDPRLILLDEPTASLDIDTEAKVIKMLNKVTKNRTTIVVSHRLPLVKSSDQIFVIENGRIIEKGNHDELIRFKGYYHGFYKNIH